MQTKTHPLAAIAAAISDQLFGPLDTQVDPAIRVGNLAKAVDRLGRPIPFNTAHEHAAVCDRIASAERWIVGNPAACAQRARSIMALRQRPRRPSADVIELQRIVADPDAPESTVRHSARILEFART